MSDANLPPPPSPLPALPPLPPRPPDEVVPRPGLLQPVVWLFAPAVATALLAHFLPSNSAVIPVLGMVLVGGLICGLRCGYLLASRWVRDPDRRTGIAILLGLACSGASVVASFVGCVAGVSTQ